MSKLPRQTHTFAELGVSPETYREVADKLKAADYDDQITDDGRIDMHGIALVLLAEPARGGIEGIKDEQAKVWEKMKRIPQKMATTSHGIARIGRKKVVQRFGAGLKSAS